MEGGTPGRTSRPGVLEISGLLVPEWLETLLRSAEVAALRPEGARWPPARLVPEPALRPAFWVDLWAVRCFGRNLQ